MIIPTTWRDIGAGVFGELGRGFSYKAYLVPGLDASGFSADEGIKLGRMTDWQNLGAGLVRGVGQRLFLADDQDRAMLEVQDIEFAVEVPETQG